MKRFKNFSRILKCLRISSCLTIKDFCLCARFAVSTYKYWESGRSLPNKDHFSQLIYFYNERGITTEELEEAYKADWLFRDMKEH